MTVQRCKIGSCRKVQHCKGLWLGSLKYCGCFGSPSPRLISVLEGSSLCVETLSSLDAFQALLGHPSVILHVSFNSDG